MEDKGGSEECAPLQMLPPGSVPSRKFLSLLLLLPANAELSWHWGALREWLSGATATGNGFAMPSALG